jgi:glyoxalase family protein
MEKLITGIHHVTAIASNAQKNIDFYRGILGLHLVKKTVNFDAPEIYHFYYGDESGRPGSILTFFPYTGLATGRHGKGMLNTISFSVPHTALSFWLSRLKKFGIKYKDPSERFALETVVYFEDWDGLGLELVFTDRDPRPGFPHGTVPAEHAVKGFYNVEIWEEGYERTAGLLTEHMDHQLVAEKGNRFRFAATDTPGNYVDVLCSPDSLRGLAGSGTVHHIAFSTPDTGTQLAVKQKLTRRLLNATPVLDRKYFSSVYFREPGNVLFEIATAGPGFAIDELPEALGESLKLPAAAENTRANLERILPAIHFQPEKFQP